MALRTRVPASAYILSLLRVIAGFCFLQHGAQKIFGVLGGLDGHGAKAHLVSMIWFAGILEFFGGLFIVFGLFTRPVAFLLCGEMAFAYFRVHAPRGFWTIHNGGEPAVLYCFIFLYLLAVGPGAVSLDRLFNRREF